MKNYELAYLISSDLSTEEAKSLSEKMAGFVSELQGTIKNNAEPEKRKLGYPIKKKAEAFLASLEFAILPEKIIGLKEKILSEKQIIRSMIIAKPKENQKKKKTRQPQPAEKNAPVGEKVEIENMDKKIDEILK
jgi:ribosomal protein S6